jgi:hypothetical protein
LRERKGRGLGKRRKENEREKIRGKKKIWNRLSIFRNYDSQNL